MNRYQYKARNKNGKIIKGYIECNNEQEFYRKIEEQDIYCMEVRQSNLSKEKASGYHLKPMEVAYFCREFAVMLLAGMNMLTALQLLYDRASKPKMKDCYMKMIEGIEKGDSLYDAMRRQKGIFPNLFMAMVLAGEASGTIDIVMDKMATYYEKEAEIRTKVINAMIYPMFLIFITLAVVILLFTFVLPQFFSLFEGKEVPGITSFFMKVSFFLTNYWYILLLLLVLLIISVKTLNRSEKFHAKFDQMILSIPVVGKVLEKLIIARFANVMNILYSSGITIVQSITISIGTVSNMYVAEKLTIVNELIEKGISLSEALQRENLFENMIWSMIQVGEESGSLETMFLKLAEYYTKESESATQKMMAVMEPVVLVFIAVIIAVVIASVLLPLYSMYEL